MTILQRRRGLMVCCLMLFAFQLHAQQFRFAWLSDTHVGSETGEADLRASMHDINTMSDVAFVVLSGDITEMGFDSQLELAKSILDSLKKPYYIIPGNHDTKWSPSGCTKFISLWGKDRFVFEYGGYRFIGMHEGPIMKMGDGHFAPEDVRWLDSVLTALPDQSQPLFFVTHYPLDPGIDNWYVVTDQLRRFNVQAALVGHGHRNLAMNFEGIPAVMGRSNLRARKAIGGFTLVDITPDTAFFSERTPGRETHPAWDKIALGRRKYSRDTITYTRPQFSVNKQYPGVRPRWTVNTGYTIASTPAVWKKYLVVGNSSGFITCFSVIDGKQIWKFKTGATVYATPDASGGRVVVGSSDKNVYCLDIASGKLLWKYTTGAPVLAAAAIDDGVVYIGGSDGTFRALDLNAGTLKWSYSGLGGFVETKPLLYEGMVIFGAWDTNLYAVDRVTGALVWKWSNGNKGVLYSPAACWPVAAHDKIFIVAPDRYITVLDARHGTVVWRSNHRTVRECVGISTNGQQVYVRCMTDTVVAFSSQALSPEEIWASDCGYGYDIDPSMPVEKDNVVTFGTKDGLVYGLDSRSGTILWEHRVGVTVVNTPVLIDGHHVVVTDFDGNITLLEWNQ